MILAYWYNQKTKEYFLESLVSKFNKDNKGYIRIGLAVDLSTLEFKYRCKRKLKKGITLPYYQHQFVVWREDLDKWTVSVIPF